ncbi:hypothetical protein EJB05_54368, partial [Eragrostis curvula]
GILHDGQEVAVKKIPALFFKESVYDEINIVINLKHENIIRPMGYCHEIIMVLCHRQGKYIGGQSMIFCFIEKLMRNGSMEHFITTGIYKKTSRHGLFDWSFCFHIILGTAQGVCYLHEQRVVHLDLKPDNILFGSDMNPRISDFGLAIKLVHVDDEITRDGSVAGTLRYMAPEYLGEGIISIKCDVYAFGVIIFRTIGLMNRCESPVRDDCAGWAEVAQDAGRLKELFGPAKVDQPQLMEIKRCIEVAVLCTQNDRHKRPIMADVLLMLSGEKEIPIPEKALA